MPISSSESSPEVAQRLAQWKREATDPTHPNYPHANLDEAVSVHATVSRLIQKLRETADEFSGDDAADLFGTLNSGKRMKNRVVAGNPLPMLRQALLDLVDGLGEPAHKIAAAHRAIKFAGRNILGELYGWANSETSPLCNSCAIGALHYLGYTFSDKDYVAFVDAHEQFKQVYTQQAGRLRPDLPLNLEIDKLYNVIDKVDLKSGGDPRPATQQYWRITLPDRYKESLPNGDEIEFDLWGPCLAHGIAAIGFDDDAEDFQVKKFKTIRPGDRIAAFLRHKTIGGIGTVTKSWDSDLWNTRSAEQDYWQGFYWFRIHVEWQAGPKNVDELPEEVRNMFIGQTVVKLSHEQYDSVAKLFEDTIPPPDILPPDEQPEAYDRQAFLDRTYLPDEQANDLQYLLLDKKQIILYGPPGTGKTYVALELAKWITRLATPLADRVEMIQFHPAYSYEDFIEGIRPESHQTGDGHFTVDYPPRPGVFRRFCEIARENPDQAHVFIIDEINRGNLPRIFGELMLLLEYRDRDVPLPYSGERFSIPPNVYMIGTMNTADRSIALVDFALRRRFHFFQFKADPELLNRWLADHPLPIPYLGNLYRRLSQEAIDDPDYAVGVSYFMDRELTEARLERVWRHSIVPYLAEYHVEQRARVKNWEWDSEFMSKIRSSE